MVHIAHRPRNRWGRYLVLRDGKPEFAVECKTGENRPSSAVHYFRERTSIPAFYQVHCGSKDYAGLHPAIRILPYKTFCSEMNMP